MGQRLQTLLAKEQGDITSKHAEFEVQVALHFRVLPLGKVLYIGNVRLVGERVHIAAVRTGPVFPSRAAKISKPS